MEQVLEGTTSGVVFPLETNGYRRILQLHVCELFALDYPVCCVVWALCALKTCRALQRSISILGV